jgi:hypothetical protein
MPKRKDMHALEELEVCFPSGEGGTGNCIGGARTRELGLCGVLLAVFLYDTIIPGMPINARLIV